MPHLKDGESAEEERVAHHKYSRAEAVLHRFEIVRVQRHEIAHLVYGVIFLREKSAPIEHSVSDVGFHLYARTEKTDTPQKATDDHYENYYYKRQTYLVEKKIRIERNKLAADFDKARIHAVYNHAVQLGDHKLKIIDENKRGYSYDEDPRILQIVSVDVSSEYQCFARRTPCAHCPFQFAILP